MLNTRVGFLWLPYGENLVEPSKSDSRSPDESAEIDVFRRMCKIFSAHLYLKFAVT